MNVCHIFIHAQGYTETHTQKPCTGSNYRVQPVRGWYCRCSHRSLSKIHWYVFSVPIDIAVSVFVLFFHCLCDSVCTFVSGS